MDNPKRTYFLLLVKEINFNIFRKSLTWSKLKKWWLYELMYDAGHDCSRVYNTVHLTSIETYRNILSR